MTPQSSATPFAEATNEMPAEAVSTDEDKRNAIFMEMYTDIKEDGILNVDFYQRTLPKLALHFDGKALDSLKQANPWLAEFEPSSVPSLERARSVFLDNGPAFLEVLASFTDLTRLESMIMIMIKQNMYTLIQSMSVLRTEIELSNEKSLKEIGNRWKPWTEDPSQDDLARIYGGVVTSSRKEALFIKGSIAQGTKIHRQEYHYNYLTVKSLFEVLWTEYYSSRPEIDKSKVKKHFREDYLPSVKSTLTYEAISHILVDYKRKVQLFVHQVGCAKVHDEPEQNIAELRLFHSITIGYFAKLQDQYVKKELEVKKLRHHVTALEFRHLLEHLPDIALHKDAGPRWRLFWEKALNDEATSFFSTTPRMPDHALKSIVDQRNPKRVDKVTKKIHTEGQNGFLHSTGKWLYSTLSDEIHGYRGAGEYNVGDDDGWTQAVTDVLSALKPLEANMNKRDADGKLIPLDWDAERLRYHT